jgi:carboxyl-terminal processing protease
MMSSLCRKFDVKLSRRTSVAILIAATILVASAGNLTLADELATPTRTDRRVSLLVAQLMQTNHLSNQPLDDMRSMRAFDNYVDNLDPLKVYFLKSDIADFERYKTKLDDQMLAGDFTAAYEVFNRFLQRLDQRTDLAIELVDQNHDFTIDEDIMTDVDQIDFAETEQEIRDRWRKRIKYSLLVMRGDEAKKKKEAAEKEEAAGEDGDDVKGNVSKPVEDPKERLKKRYQSYNKRMHQFDSEDVVELYITSVTTSYDPHTTYMSKRSFENFMIQMGLELEGIGATLQATDEGYTVIKSIVKGGAVDTQGGLEVEDKITAVAQGDEDGGRAYEKLFREHGGEFVDVNGMKLDDVVAMIRGKAGTVVRLSVLSENDTELKIVSIVREKIKLEESAAQGEVFEEGAKPDGSPFKIGVIELPSFYASMDGAIGGRSTTNDVKKILRDFNSQSVDALVLDLRRNGGGSLREAIDCTGLFIDRGPVVQVKDSRGEILEHKDVAAGMEWSKPLVVLTSKFSASASEILAGAVQDYGRGLVVGDTTTHGKGTVQSLMNLNQVLFRVRNPPNVFGALKITMQQFYRPNGDSTQLRGVLSDLVLPSISDKMDVAESDLDYPVEFDHIPKANYRQLSLVNPEIAQELASRSAERIEQSEDFARRKRKINTYVEQKALKRVSLNEEKFLARRRELNAEKEDEEAIEKQMNPGEGIEKDFYLEEVLKIARDYCNLLASNN